jgi:hypothetical protein
LRERVRVRVDLAKNHPPDLSLEGKRNKSFFELRKNRVQILILLFTTCCNDNEIDTQPSV